jgi:ribose-phosphate pyrophosphokinase
MHKSRDHTGSSKVDKSTLIGDTDDISSKTAIIVDDMIDTGGTMVRGIEELATFGITEVILVVTHGILSGPAVTRLMECKTIKEVVVTNTLPIDCFPTFSKLKVIDVSKLFGEILHRIFVGKSVSQLFS